MAPSLYVANIFEGGPVASSGTWRTVVHTIKSSQTYTRGTSLAVRAQLQHPQIGMFEESSYCGSFLRSLITQSYPRFRLSLPISTSIKKPKDSFPFVERIHHQQIIISSLLRNRKVTFDAKCSRVVNEIREEERVRSERSFFK